MLKALALVLSLTFTAISAFASDCGNDIVRLRELGGAYEGMLKTESREVPIRITLIAVSIPGSVRFEGFYERLDVPGVIDLSLEVTHCQQLDSTELTMTGKGPLNYAIDIRATYSELMLAGNLEHMSKGPNGTFVLEKK